MNADLGRFESPAYVVAGLVPATPKSNGRAKIIEVPGTSPATTNMEKFQRDGMCFGAIPLFASWMSFQIR